MTTVLIENVDRESYPHLPPIIYTDSQATFSYHSWFLRVLSKCWLYPKAGEYHSQQKIFKACGGWITGSGDLDTLLVFYEGMALDLWGKPRWDYNSAIMYVTKAGATYVVSPNPEMAYKDDVAKQGWVWKRMSYNKDGGKGKFFCCGSGTEYCLEAYSVQSMKAESAIKYAAKYDEFTNDVIQCNIDFKTRGEEEGFYYEE